MKKKVNVVSFKEMIFLCDGSEVIVKADDISSLSHEEECDLCGSHGEVEVGFTCPLCGNYHEVKLLSW